MTTCPVSLSPESGTRKLFTDSSFVDYSATGHTPLNGISLACSRREFLAVTGDQIELNGMIQGQRPAHRLAVYIQT
jgi:hypothetical protein